MARSTLSALVVTVPEHCLVRLFLSTATVCVCININFVEQLVGSRAARPRLHLRAEGLLFSYDTSTT